VFRRVLIANRGEIALRIIRGCREVGAETVVVHSEADRGAPWLEHADQTVCVGGARADESYLNAGAILQAAEQTGSQAIHPGYGFLAENQLFAARCEQQGITFVGPTAAAIRAMGDKVSAKRTMARAGLPTIPGSDGPVASLGEARRIAGEVGFPVLLKAAAGGGGKGMRRCDRESGLEQAFGQARLEAEKAFGDPTLYLEKLITGGRHIEFQVLCDAFGSGIHLGERDCSIQRKHQKLIEESPSPAIAASERDTFGRRVASAVAGIGYRGAGTVEFLRAEDGQLYFMEMNTRLQVEHPVTEMISGVDLVVEQLKVAANRPLEWTQQAIRLAGHAIEFRINAEDPDDDFRPDPGTIRAFKPPGAEDPRIRVRWDSAIRAGYKIPPYYDSLVGKLIVSGPDREETLAAAEQVLAGMRIEGIRTTIPFHRSLLQSERFRAGDYDIDFLANRSAGAS
jgi:acetyl-CoA carboxylase biotin carboxylase subunit